MVVHVTQGDARAEVDLGRVGGFHYREVGKIKIKKRYNDMVFDRDYC